MYCATKTLASRVFSLFLAYLLGVSALGVDVSQVYANEMLMPSLGTAVSMSEAYELPKVIGYKLNANNPLQIEFIVNQGDAKENIQEDLMRCVNYFLAALTTDKEKIWVNLSPYEADRIIDSEIESTDMGRDLLAQDYLLKQLSASLTNPKTSLGKSYWENNSTSDKLNKLWISPNSAQVYDQDNMVVITEASLQVQSEDGAKNVLIAPITTDVNYGKNFARLRQIYNSLILAQTFKTKFINSLYQHYINKGKLNGIEIDDKTSKERIYSLYVDAFKKGAYNITQKEYDHNLNQKVKRQYFAGGVTSSSLQVKTTTNVSSAIEVLKEAYNLLISLFDKNDESVILGDSNYPVNKQEDLEDKFTYLADLINTRDARILLVEDNVYAREFTKLYLEPSGHEIVEFEDGSDAYEFLKQDNAFDFVITDYRMLKMNGDELIRRIRSEFELDIPIIVPTGDPDAQKLLAVKDDNVEIYHKQIFEKEIYTGESLKDNLPYIYKHIIKARVAKNPIELKKLMASDKDIVYDKKGIIDFIAGERALTILLAEDNKSIQLTLVKMLNRLGNNVITADDGLEALDKLEERLAEGKSFDLIISDNQMPLMHGTEWLSEAIKKFDIKSTPKLLQSATVDKDDLIQFGEEYDVLVFSKEPFQRDLSDAFKQNNLSSAIKLKNQLVVAQTDDFDGALSDYSDSLKELRFESSGFKEDLDRLLGNVGINSLDMINYFELNHLPRSEQYIKATRYFVFDDYNSANNRARYILRYYKLNKGYRVDIIGADEAHFEIKSKIRFLLLKAGVKFETVRAFELAKFKVDSGLKGDHIVVHKRDKVEYVDGGIKMNDFAVEGMSSSSLFNGLTVNPLVFDKLSPRFVSFTEIDSISEYLKN